MKKIISFIFLFFAVAANADIAIKSFVSAAKASADFDYSFSLSEENPFQLITDKDLVETHTKILHLVVYDAALNQFNHVHPAYKNNMWNAKLNLSVNGNYTIWAQGKTQGGTEFSVSTALLVEGGTLENPVVALGDVRVGADGVTQIELASTKIKAGKMVMIDFMVSRTDGSKPKLSPYLGAFAHVIATQLSGSELIHVHPMEGGMENMGMLHATFPVAGEYRLWVQLMDDNVLRTIPLSVVVK